ncbi:MAG: neocarzinostatin apoprotein domain-containing protein [Acidimicrobiales bacterium]
MTWIVTSSVVVPFPQSHDRRSAGACELVIFSPRIGCRRRAPPSGSPGGGLPPPGLSAVPAAGLVDQQRLTVSGTGLGADATPALLECTATWCADVGGGQADDLGPCS